MLCSYLRVNSKISPIITISNFVTHIRYVSVEAGTILKCYFADKVLTFVKRRLLYSGDIRNSTNYISYAIMKFHWMTKKNKISTYRTQLLSLSTIKSYCFINGV